MHFFQIILPLSVKLLYSFFIFYFHLSFVFFGFEILYSFAETCYNIFNDFFTRSI